MTKSKVMPTAMLRGAPLCRLAYTYIFPINSPACQGCYTIGLKVDCLTLSHVRPSAFIGESDQISKALHIFYKGIAFFCKGVAIKKGM